MIEKIEIREIYRNKGVGKNKRPYSLTKLLSTDSNYYCTFENVEALNKAQKGDSITLEAEPSGKEHYFNIIKVREVVPPKSHAGEGEEKPEQPGARMQLVVNEALEKAIAEKAERRLQKAKQIVDKIFNRQPDLDYSLYDHTLAEVYRSLYGEEAMLQIQKGKRV